MKLLKLLFDCQGQVSRAEQAEEMFILKRELVALRRHDSEVSEKLKESTRRVSYLDSKLQGVSCPTRVSSHFQLVMVGIQLRRHPTFDSCRVFTIISIPDLS